MSTVLERLQRPASPPQPGACRAGAATLGWDGSGLLLERDGAPQGQRYSAGQALALQATRWRRRGPRGWWGRVSGARGEAASLLVLRLTLAADPASGQPPRTLTLESVAPDAALRGLAWRPGEGSSVGLADALAIVDAARHLGAPVVAWRPEEAVAPPSWPQPWVYRRRRRRPVWLRAAGAALMVAGAALMAPRLIEGYASADPFTLDAALAWRWLVGWGLVAMGAVAWLRDGGARRVVIDAAHHEVWPAHLAGLPLRAPVGLAALEAVEVRVDAPPGGDAARARCAVWLVGPGRRVQVDAELTQDEAAALADELAARAQLEQRWTQAARRGAARRALTWLARRRPLGALALIVGVVALARWAWVGWMLAPGELERAPTLAEHRALALDDAAQAPSGAPRAAALAPGGRPPQAWRDATLSRDGRVVIAVREDGRVELRRPGRPGDEAAGELLVSVPAPGLDATRQLDLSTRSWRLAHERGDGPGVRVLDVGTGAHLGDFPGQRPVLSDDGARLYTVRASGAVSAWRLPPP